jgi:hypothetical protein
MAIEIKRTPVLTGDAAKAFLDAVHETPKKVSEQKVRAAIAKSKKILSVHKSGSK